jgi:probable HAF family extracellular repeat protein
MLAIVTLLGSPVLGQPAFDLIDLGTLEDGNTSEAFAINDLGQVVGAADSPMYGRQAFIWDDVNGMRPIGTLGGNSGYARAINNSGQVVGYSQVAAGGNHAFLWDEASGITDPGTCPDADTTTAYGINEQGLIVGACFTASGYGRAAIWHPTFGWMYLCELGTPTKAMGIDDLGVVVGGPPAGQWKPYGGLETLVGNGSVWAINNNGQIVGSNGNVNQRYACLWEDVDTVIDLGSLGGASPQGNTGAGKAINDIGQVVGYSWTSGGAVHAFFWQTLTGMMDLNDMVDPGLGWTLGQADGINNNGWIVGVGMPPRGDAGHAFLLIPEPTCWDANECAGQPYGDATCDGLINLADLYALKARFSKCAPWQIGECCADFTQSGCVGLDDIFTLKANFGTAGYAPSTGNQTCPP